MHEIIHVVDAASTGGLAPMAAAEEFPALAPGYYFVLWPRRQGAAKRRGRRYFGPLRTAGEARLLLTSALMLGLAADERQPASAECRSIARNTAAANESFPLPDGARAGRGAF